MRRSAKVAIGAVAGALPLLAMQTSAGAVEAKEDTATTTVTFTRTDDETVSCVLTGTHQWMLYDETFDELFAEFNVQPATSADSFEECRGALVIRVRADEGGPNQEDLGNSYAFPASRAQYIQYNVGDRPYEVGYSFVPVDCDSTVQHCHFSISTSTK